MVAVRKPEGIVCFPGGTSSSWRGNDNSVGSWSSWNSARLPSQSVAFTDHRIPHKTPATRRHSHILPGPHQRISARDMRCLSTEQVFWPEDEECHSLLTKVCLLDCEFVMNYIICIEDDPLTAHSLLILGPLSK